MAQNVVSTADRFVLALMLCTFAEWLLASLNRDIMNQQSVPERHADLLIDGNEGRSKLMKLFKGLTGTSFAEETTRVGMAGWYQSWDTLVKLRNLFAHGTPPLEGSRFTPKDSDLDTMRDGLLKTFRLLTNEHAARPPST